MDKYFIFYRIRGDIIHCERGRRAKNVVAKIKNKYYLFLIFKLIINNKFHYYLQLCVPYLQFLMLIENCCRRKEYGRRTRSAEENPKSWPVTIGHPFHKEDGTAVALYYIQVVHDWTRAAKVIASIKQLFSKQ